MTLSDVADLHVSGSLGASGGGGPANSDVEQADKSSFSALQERWRRRGTAGGSGGEERRASPHGCV